MIKDLLYKAQIRGEVVVKEEERLASYNRLVAEQRKQDLKDELTILASNYTAKIFGEEHRIAPSEWVLPTLGNFSTVRVRVSVRNQTYLQYKVETDEWGLGLHNPSTGYLQIFNGTRVNTIKDWNQFAKEIFKLKEEGKLDS